MAFGQRKELYTFTLKLATLKFSDVCVSYITTQLQKPPKKLIIVILYFKMLDSSIIYGLYYYKLQRYFDKCNNSRKILIQFTDYILRIFFFFNSLCLYT